MQTEQTADLQMSDVACVCVWVAVVVTVNLPFARKVIVIRLRICHLFEFCRL